jgi:hypothetical protein
MRTGVAPVPWSRPLACRPGYIPFVLLKINVRDKEMLLWLVDYEQKMLLLPVTTIETTIKLMR